MMIFDKLDGSNIRAEWSKKTGWYKFGTRTRLVDETDPMFGPAIPVFMNTLAEPLARIGTDKRWERMIIFGEFMGANSFAGVHDPADPKTITLFDVNPHKKGIIGPKEFLKTFEGIVPLPKFLGEMRWNRSFVEKVRNGEIDGITLEGVVGKAGEGHQLVMAKAKTQAWIDQVKAKFTAEQAEKIINS